MQIIKNKERLSYNVYIVAIMLELIVMMTDHFASWTIPYRGRITHLAFALFCLKILCTKYKKSMCVVIGITGIIGLISYITCGDEYMIRIVALLAASVDIELERLLKLVFYISLAGTVIIIVLSLVGMTGNISETRDFGRGAIETRYCLGFNHANNVHDMLWYLISCYVLLRREKCRWLDYLIMTLVNIGLYYLTLSRTGAITVQLVIISCLITRYIRHILLDIVIYLGGIAGYVGLVTISIYCSIYNMSDREFVVKVDKLLNGRMELLTEQANFKDWMLFPPQRSAELVDNGFVAFTFSFGVICGILLLLFILWEMYSVIRRNNVQAFVLILGTVLILFMESTFVFNISLLCNFLLILAIFIINMDSIGNVNYE